MPTRPLTQAETFQTIIDWLNQNLDENKRIKACCEEVKKVSQNKGIYFWFMHPQAYSALNIKSIEPKYTRNINGIKYDLVYLGTAGTGKQGNSNLFDRFKWHINQNHSVSNICHGTLSTLRAGLGALLSDDLILLNTEIEVNTFMKNYMKVFWIEYPDNIPLIDNDEKILIKGIKPLLNLKNNPNARANAPANSTQVYKIRRSEVYKNTRLRLGCTGESKKNREKSNPNDYTPKYNHQVMEENNEGCIEYFVLQHQHIGEVTRGIQGLPLGKSKITIYDSLNPDNEFTQWRRETGDNNNYDAQNIYKYFDNTSTNGQRRFEVIQNWMLDNGIKEITVRVCAENINKSNITSPPIKNSPIPVGNNVNYNEIYLIPCSNGKNHNGNQISTIQQLSFNEILGHCREYLQNLYLATGKTINWNNCMPAYDRYIGRTLYSVQVRDAIQQNPERVLIVSALFGIIRPTDLIPDYDLAMDGKINNIRIYDFWKNHYENCKKCVLNDVLIAIKNINQNVVFINLLSAPYQRAFCGFTAGNIVPQLNYVPNLIQPPNHYDVNTEDRFGSWKKSYLIRRI